MLNTNYIFTILYNIFCLFGVFAVIIIVSLPFIMAFYGYKSIKLKLKKKKSHKLDNQKQTNQKFYEQRYIDRLHKNIKRKKHR
jgi:predicted membrane protein